MKISKQAIPIPQVITDLTAMFGVDNKKVILANNTFLVNKSVYMRHEVISMLSTYFETRTVLNGYVSVSPITLVFTSFSICSGSPT